jgi:hypothetical protein
MDRKRAAASAFTALQVEETPSNDSAVSTVTPEKAKKPRQNERGDPNPTGDSTSNSEPEEEEDNGRGEEEEEANDGNEDEEEEEDDSNRVTADTVMGFPKYPEATNREIMTQHYDFVKWAKSKKESDSAFGRLLDFVEWAESPEGKSLELEAKGNEVFTYGQHKGQTFADIARCDPEYHIRYMRMLKRKGESPNEKLVAYINWFKSTRRPSAVHSGTLTRTSNVSISYSGNERFTFGQHCGRTFREVADEDPSYHLRYRAVNQRPNTVLDRYIRYFDRYGDPYAAHQGELDALAYHAGIMRPCWFGM